MEIKKTASIALLAVAFTIGVLCFTNRAVTPRQATWDDVLAEARAGGYRIITTDELAERYRRDADRLLLVDTRQEWEYRTGHLKGAVNIPMEPTWWSRWRKGSTLAACLGPDRERSIIFY